MGSDALILPRRHCDPGLNPGKQSRSKCTIIADVATRSILEGAKALVRANRRAISNPNQQSLAVALSQLEEEIASFDARQRHVALTALGGPQRIRGLAGVISGDMRVGTPVVIRRPDRNSPTHLSAPDGFPLIQVRGFDSIQEEVNFCAEEFTRFLAGGLQPEDLMAIAIDDRAAKAYLSALAAALAERGISSNNIIADRYSEPAFTIAGKTTLSTVYRAKGNEAAVVAVLGGDAVPLNTRTGRNRLFTAFTRTKGWLRITGMGESFAPLRAEVRTATGFASEMRFQMPDPTEIEFIQRDLSEKNARVQRAQAEMERMKDDLGLTDEDLKTLIGARRRNGRT
jgi:superfamily I DNA and RNA helicase